MYLGICFVLGEYLIVSMKTGWNTVFFSCFAAVTELSYCVIHNLTPSQRALTNAAFFITSSSSFFFFFFLASSIYRFFYYGGEGDRIIR